MRIRSRGRLLAAMVLTIASLPVRAAAPVAIAIVIDDLGDRPVETRMATELPGPVACAFLPESPYTRRYADAAHAAGKEVLLHLPLQPIAAKPNPLTMVTSESDPRSEERSVGIECVSTVRYRWSSDLYKKHYIITSRINI